MRNRHPALKRALSILLSLALVLPASVALIGDSGTAEAKASLPYIEELKSQQGGAFNILEIAPSADEGSFGYYLKGEEPCAEFPAKAAADANNIQKDSDGKIVPSDQRSKRQAYVQGLFAGLAKAGIFGNSNSYPLTQNGTYEEKYPWELTPGNSSSFNNKLSLKDTGGSPYYDKGYAKNIHFEALPADLAPGTDISAYAYVSATSYRLDAGGSYVQDVAYYTSNSADIDNLKNNLHETLYYYSLKFTKITVDVDEESGAVTAYSNAAKTEKLKDGEAIYASAADYNTPESTVVPDPGSFAYTSLHYIADGSAKLDENHSYYIVSGVSEPKAAPDETRYQGDSAYSPYQYAAVTQNDGFREKADGETGYFSPVDGTTPTYRYVGPGSGTYKIEAGSTVANILTPVVYYNTCYKNNEWFKKYVFDCDSDSDGNVTEALKLHFTLTTKAPQDVTLDDVNGASLIFLSYGMNLDAIGKNTVTDDNNTFSSDISESIQNRIIALALRTQKEAVTPLIIDSRLQMSTNGKIPNLIALSKDSRFGVSGSMSVKDNVYLYTPDQARPNFVTASWITKFANTNPYREVSDEINVYNIQHSAQGAEKLSSDVTMAAVVRHIVNASCPTVTKGTIRVLEIEPGKSYNGTSQLTVSTVINTWLNDSSYQVKMTTWSTAELIGRIDDLGENFDTVYIGTNIDGYNTEQLGSSDLNQTVVDCTDNNMDGLVYTNIGDIIRSGGGNGYSLSGLLDRDYYSYKGKNYIDATDSSLANQFRFSGNDLTEQTMQSLEDYAAAGHPVVLADDLLNSARKISDATAGHIHVMGDLLGLLDSDFSYSIKASKTSLTVNPETQNWLENLFGYFFGNSSFNQLKDGINNPIYSWQYSTDRNTWVSIGSNSTKTINIAPYDNGTYFRCLVNINRFNLSIWTVTGSAYTQTVQLNSGTVNEARIDNCSYMYQLLNNLKGKSNTFSEGFFTAPYTGADDSKARMEQKAFAALVNISNPEVQWVPVNGNQTGYPTAYAMNNGSMTSLAETNGKCSLDYSFKITNPTQTSPSTTYTCNLYVDSNGDGRFSEEEKLENVEVFDQERRLVTNLYVSTGIETNQYTISRPLPDDFCGIVPWKLEIVQKGTPGIHTSKTGFTHIKSTAKRPAKAIKVLQITPSNQTNTVNLNGADYQDLFKQIKDDYSITINQTNVGNSLTFNDLNKYDMLILGFGDAYGDMSANTAQAINQYISTGKAVLFSHDCASFFALPDKSYSQIRSGGMGFSTNYVYSSGSWDIFRWFTTYYGYNFNTTLRDIVGLDRYGVSSVAFGGTSKNGQISKSGPVASSYSGADLSKIKAAGYSIAYQPGSAPGGDLSKAKTVPETQGLTNNILMRFYTSGNLPYGYANKSTSQFWKDLMNSIIQNGAQRNILQTTKYVTQVNKGQITTYPFDVNTSGFRSDNKLGTDYMNISETHMQYQQLNMNSDDLVVWYCLSGGGSSNVINTLTLGSTYDNMTNDVLNQYYIYTRGNITYTGSGHSADQTDEERKLLVNTIIAAYRHAQAAPSAVFTDASGGKTGVSTILVPSDNGGVVKSTGVSNDETRRIYFKIQNASFGSDKVQKTYNATFQITVGNGTAGKTNNVTISAYYLNENGVQTPVSANQFRPGQVCFVNLDELLDQTGVELGGSTGQTVSFSVTPSVTVTQSGNVNTLTGSPVSVNISRMNLFDLG